MVNVTARASCQFVSFSLCPNSAGVKRAWEGASTGKEHSTGALPDFIMSRNNPALYPEAENLIPQGLLQT